MADELQILLQLPFNNDYPISFRFGDKPSDDAIKKKYEEWGLVGHNGLDYQIPEGTEIITVDTGKIIQSGDNGDFGISVTIQHSWGQSLYAHLQESKVSQDQEVKTGDIIGLSGKTGFVTGPHLHFGIKPNNADANNGYLGFIDPLSYFQKKEEKPTEETTPQLQESQPNGPPKVGEAKPPDEKPHQPQNPELKVIEKEVIKEVVKEVIKEVPVVNQEEVNRQVEQKLKQQLLENKRKADEKRAQNRKDNLNNILSFVQEKKQISNQDIRDLLRISQSTATNYLSGLVSKGLLKVENKARATIYTQ